MLYVPGQPLNVSLACYQGTVITVIALGGAAVTWAGNTQRCVTLSTSEGGYDTFERNRRQGVFIKICACCLSEATDLTSIISRFL